MLVIRDQLLGVLLLALAASTASAPLAWTYATGNYSWAVAVSPDGRYVIGGSDDMRSYSFRTDSGGVPSWTYSSSEYVQNVAKPADEFGIG